MNSIHGNDAVRQKIVLGIPVIDAQHQKIIQSLNLFEEAVNKKFDKTGILFLFEQMIKFAKHHFKYELKFLAKIKFPKTVKHKKLHDALLCEIDDLFQKFKSNELLLTAGVVRYLHDWVVEHILTDDRVFCDFYKMKFIPAMKRRIK